MLRKANNGFNKQKYSCLKPEMLHLKTEYSFSYNPEEQPLFEQFYKVKLNTLNKWSEYYSALFTSLKYCKIICYMEISSKGRFHYHGLVMVTDIPRFIINDLAKLRHYGTYEIDEIKDKTVWLDYCLKQQRFMEKYCKDNDMLYKVVGYQATA